MKDIVSGRVAGFRGGGSRSLSLQGFRGLGFRGLGV